MCVSNNNRSSGMAEARAYGWKVLIFGRWVLSDTGIPRHTKQNIYDEYIASTTTKCMRYEVLRLEAARLVSTGMSVSDAAKCIGLKYQTVWRWKLKRED